MVKKGKGKKGKGDSSDEEELVSTADDDSVLPSTQTATPSFDMSEAIDMLSEKKINLREPALRNIITFLQGSHEDEEKLTVLNGYIETLTLQLTRMIRRPASTKEGELTLQLLSLLALYLAGAADLPEKAISQLVDHPNPLQPTAVFTYAFLAYLSQTDLLIRAVDTLQSKFGDELGDEVHVRAVDGWVLLASLLPVQEVLERSKDEVFEALALLIEDSSVAVKASAGKAIAFIYETADKVHPGLPLSELSYHISSDPHTVEQALQCMRTITKESSKSISKKNRKEARSVFRDILEYLDNSEKPSEVIRMQGADVIVEGFAQGCVADTLREVLGSGFQSALLAFPVVRDILSVEYVSEGLSATKKVSKDSAKLRSKDRARDRDFREAYAADFMEDEV